MASFNRERVFFLRYGFQVLERVFTVTMIITAEWLAVRFFHDVERRIRDVRRLASIQGNSWRTTLNGQPEANTRR